MRSIICPMQVIWGLNLAKIGAIKFSTSIMKGCYVRKVVFLYCVGETISTRKCKEQRGIEMGCTEISANRSY